MAFVHDQPVLFRHCDPAGIVFFPRLFEMVNDCTEAFFAQIGHPFEAIHPARAVPTAQIEARFAEPSRHGDRLTFRLEVTRIGGSSLGLAHEARAGEALRLAARSTLVHVGADGRPRPWPEDLRAAFAPHLRSTP